MDGIKAPPKAGARVQAPAITVVVSLSGANSSTAFLSAWGEQLAGKEVLVVTADGSAFNGSLPAGAKAVTGPPAGLDPQVASKAKLSGRDLALLSAKSPHVLFISEGSTPATTPKGEVVQVVQEHSTNLTTPATPVFFNTLYDPFRLGADFVRGYPFSMRDGVKTALSNGLSLGVPDYDAATQLAKAQERNTRYVDATLTVPKEAFCIFSARNLALDKSLVGIASYNGVDAAGKPVNAEVDNTWASYSIKTLANHLGFGCKTGLPYVTSSAATATAASADAEKQLKSVQWQKEILSFFQGVKLSASSTTPEAAYLELASLVKQQLGPVDTYFVQQAAAMEAWAQAFKAASA